MNNPAVSVIIPMFNSSEYIYDSLLSLINQDFNNFEIIIIDDGSEDDSLDKAFEILSKSSIPHKIVHQRNSGASVARNHGIDLSRGEYLIFLDSDDYISRDFISSLYNKITMYDSDFAFSKIIKMDNKGNNLTNLNHFKILKDKEFISTIELIKLDLLMKIPFSFVQIMYKSSLIKENNLKFNEKLNYGEDTDFALKALINGDSVVISKNGLYFYHQREFSITSTLYLKRFSFINTLEKLGIYFKNKGYPELNNLIITNRIPKAIFGNMIYFFYKDYPFNEIIDEMKSLDLFSKLNNFKIKEKNDLLFFIKSKCFLLSPKIYYKFWKIFKNSI